MSTTPPANTPSSTSEIRRHYYLDQYVIVSPSRHQRPDTFGAAPAPHLRPGERCPFCSSHETTLLALPNAKNWRVRVVPNAFPAVTLTNPKAYGVMEVVIDTPDDTKEFSSLSVSHIETILQAYQNRLEALRKLPHIRYVTVFKNDGPVAAASVSHAHSQVIALGLVPPQAEFERNALNAYHDQHGRCAVCDLASWERSEKVRVISSNAQLLTLAPYASTHPYETWFIPRRHLGSLAELTAAERRALAVSLKAITTKLDDAVISFNFFVQESLPDQPHHLVIKLEPRLPLFYGGAEFATGVIINTVSPEAAAAWYRNKK